MNLDKIVQEICTSGVDRDTFIKKIQEAYKICVDEDKKDQLGGLCFNIREIPESIKATGIKPAEEVVQEAYLTCIKRDILRHRNTDTLKDLMDATGIKPRFPEEFILETCNKLICDPLNIKALKEIAGIEPKFSEELVQKAYLGCLRAGESGRLPIEQIKTIIETTGIKPSGEMIRRMIHAYLGYGNDHIDSFPESDNRYCHKMQLFNALNFTAVAEIKLKLSDRIIREAYAVCFKSRHDLYHAEELLNATETYPPEEMVQKEYDHVCADHSVYRLKSLLEVTKVKPKLSEEVVQKIYSDCIDYEEFETLKEFQGVTGIKPAEAMIQDKYLQCVQEGKINRLEALRRVTGIKPWEEVYYRSKLKGTFIVD